MLTIFAIFIVIFIFSIFASLLFKLIHTLLLFCSSQSISSLLLLLFLHPLLFLFFFDSGEVFLILSIFDFNTRIRVNVHSHTINKLQMLEVDLFIVGLTIFNIIGLTTCSDIYFKIVRFASLLSCMENRHIQFRCWEINLELFCFFQSHIGRTSPGNMLFEITSSTSLFSYNSSCIKTTLYIRISRWNHYTINADPTLLVLSQSVN
jgi:hypothetical protein